MSYASSSPPRLMVAIVGGSVGSTASAYYGGQQWYYASTADNQSTVCGSSYFTNGWALGMRKYDSVRFVDVASTLDYWLTVTSVTSASGGAGVTLASALTT